MLREAINLGRRIAKVFYWTATFQIHRRYRMWQEAKNVVGSEEAYDAWVATYDTLTERDCVLIRQDIERFDRQPLISVVMPTYETDPDLLRQAIQSVRSQLYETWELCIADDASRNPQVATVIDEFARSDARIKWVVRDANGNISHASNTALELATGEFVALMDHDDLIPRHALYRVAREINAYPDANLIYSDEDQIDAAGRRHTPYFKPALNIDLLLGQNVVCHLGVYRTSLLREIGGFRAGYEGSQDHDLALRTVERSPPSTIRHIPAVLYHWRRMEGGSFSQEQMERCQIAAERAVNDRLMTMLGAGSTHRVSRTPQNWTRVHWPVPTPSPSVSIIIPTRDRADLLRACVDGLLNRTHYSAFEIIIVDNDSVEPSTEALFAELSADPRVRIMKQSGDFNYSRLNNLAVSQSSADVVLLLNNDVEVIEPDWLTEMVSHAIRPDVGAVGAKLLYADGVVQHAGVLLGAGFFEGNLGIAGHFGHAATQNDPGYFGQFALTRQLSAVTGACLAMRRDVFVALGGLDEVNLKIAFNDIDLCLRVQEAGFRVVWTPFAELYHHESQSRGDDLHGEKAMRFERECQYMTKRWREKLESDPFYSPNFQRNYVDFRLSESMTTTKPWLVDI